MAAPSLAAAPKFESLRCSFDDVKIKSFLGSGGFGGSAALERCRPSEHSIVHLLSSPCSFAAVVYSGYYKGMSVAIKTVDFKASACRNIFFL